MTVREPRGSDDDTLIWHLDHNTPASTMCLLPSKALLLNSSPTHHCNVSIWGLDCLVTCWFREWNGDTPNCPVTGQQKDAGWACVLSAIPFYPLGFMLLLVKVSFKKKKPSLSQDQPHPLIPAYLRSQVFIWQVLSFLAHRGSHSCFEHTVWD